jgi:putative ABC transport system permease protein
MVYLFSGWIVTLFDTHGIIGNTNITFEMLFNPLIVGIAMVVCLILNLISALVPALLSLRHGIIYSLNSKR